MVKEPHIVNPKALRLQLEEGVGFQPVGTLVTRGHFTKYLIERQFVTNQNQEPLPWVSTYAQCSKWHWYYTHT
jgi:hypothetical protein